MFLMEPVTRKATMRRRAGTVIKEAKNQTDSKKNKDVRNNLTALFHNSTTSHDYPWFVN